VFSPQIDPKAALGLPRASCRREKVFGLGRPAPSTATPRSELCTGALSQREGQGAYGLVTAKALAGFEALLWGFHNAKSGRCFPFYERIAEGAAAITPRPCRSAALSRTERSQRRSPRLRRKQRKEQIAGAVGFRSSSVQASGLTLMSNTMWGGRFAAGPAKVMEEFNASIDFDRNLASQDIAGS
jgi:hypothetical protein